ncbi:Rho GTPase activation protein [Pelagophyceae sp. CCMP2097]|nr:Rho GTPase activation protein [Pelagophyceae sp. CCMP2097]
MNRLKGFALGRKDKKDAAPDDDDSAGPNASRPKIGSAAWRRRLEESLLQKVGMSKAEKDENTGDLEDEVAKFRSTVVKLSQFAAKTDRMAEAASQLYDATAHFAMCYDGSDADEMTWGGVAAHATAADGDDTRYVVAAVLATDEQALLEALLRGWVSGGISATLEYSGRLANVIKHRENVALDYFARKRRFESAAASAAAKAGNAKLDDDLVQRRAKFEHSANEVRALTAYLGPLLRAFQDAAHAARQDVLRALAATRLVHLEDCAARLRPWAASLVDSQAADSGPAGTARELLRQVRASRTGGHAAPRPTAPHTTAFKTLAALVESPPRLSEYVAPQLGKGAMASPNAQQRASNSKVFNGAPLGAEAVAALEALLQRLESGGGLEREGLFRIPGSTEVVNDLKAQLDSASNSPQRVLRDAELDDVATLTKMWFRERSRDEPLVSASLNQKLRDASASYCDDAGFGASCLAALRLEDATRRHCLVQLLSFLHRVALNASQNMMTAENLAICFAPNVVLRNPDDAAALMDLQPSISLMERLVAAAPWIDGSASDLDDATTPPSPPPRP